MAAQYPSAKVLLLWSDPHERQALFKILCATGAQVVYGTPDADGSYPISDEACRLVVVDYDSLDSNIRGILGQAARLPRRPAVLVVTAKRDKSELVEIFSHEAFTNLIAKNIEIDSTELIVTVQKIIRNDIFGFEKYLTWGIAPMEEVIRSSSAKAPLLESLRGYLTAIGVNRRLIGIAVGVAEEFVMNAVYNAPVDAAGMAKYTSRPRSEPVELGAGEEALFRYACDGRTLALSIEDPFGRLESATVLSYLRKCFIGGGEQIDEKSGGAGLGLYCIFESLNHLIVNVERNRRTEMIGLMDISGTYRDFAEKTKSLNIFIQESAT